MSWYGSRKTEPERAQLCLLLQQGSKPIVKTDISVNDSITFFPSEMSADLALETENGRAAAEGPLASAWWRLRAHLRRVYRRCCAPCGPDWSMDQ